MKFRLMQRQGRKEVELASFGTIQDCIREGDRRVKKGALGLFVLTDKEGRDALVAQSDHHDTATGKGAITVNSGGDGKDA